MPELNHHTPPSPFRLLGAAALLLLPTVAGPAAQSPPSRLLTLDGAIELARLNNPSYLSRSNDQDAADWLVREAYASFLPMLRARSAITYREPGVQRIGVIDLGAATTDYLW